MDEVDSPTTGNDNVLDGTALGLSRGRRADRRPNRLFASILPLVLLCVSTACSGGAKRRNPPRIDAAAAGAAAISALDSNGDGAIDSTEVKSSPGLGMAQRAIDQNDDSKLSADEIAARVAYWSADRVALVPVACTVVKGGVPLGNVSVKFIPEPFLGPHIKPASGVSDPATGRVHLSIEGEKIPGVLHCGLYRVELSQQRAGKEMIPERFNVHTMLGEEITADSGRRKEGIVYDVSRKTP